MAAVVVAAEGSTGQAEADGVPLRVPSVLEDAASTAMAVLTHHLCDCQFFLNSRKLFTCQDPDHLWVVLLHLQP